MFFSFPSLFINSASITSSLLFNPTSQPNQQPPTSTHSCCDPCYPSLFFHTPRSQNWVLFPASPILGLLVLKPGGLLFQRGSACKGLTTCTFPNASSHLAILPSLSPPLFQMVCFALASKIHLLLLDLLLEATEPALLPKAFSSFVSSLAPLTTLAASSRTFFSSLV